MQKTVLLITHDYAETGFVGQALLEAGHIVKTHEVIPYGDDGEQLANVDFPDPEGFDAVIAFGSFEHVYDVAGEWVRKEIDYIAGLHQQGIPYLGICFGAQLLAESLGGKTVPSDRLEAGLITFDAGATCPISHGPWFCWHTDKVELPEHVSILATTAIAPQVFQSGRSIGVQFHPELVGGLLDAWIDLGGHELKGLHDIVELRSAWAAHEPYAERNTKELLEWFLRP